VYLKSPVRDPVDCGEVAPKGFGEAGRLGEGASRTGVGQNMFNWVLYRNHIIHN